MSIGIFFFLSLQNVERACSKGVVKCAILHFVRFFAEKSNKTENTVLFEREKSFN